MRQILTLWGAMKIILHAGMHKTGSSTIQETFGTLEQDAYRYAPWSTNNHSGLYILGFLDEGKLEDFHNYKARGIKLPVLLKRREKLHRTLHEALENCDRPMFLISGEAMSGSHDSTAMRLADFCRQYTDDIEVIAYVRPPASYMQSAFQQRVKGRSDTTGESVLPTPRYKARFSPLEAAFGRDRVKLKMFDRARLKDGDVAVDFGTEIGVPITKDQVVNTNESISLEATALVYVFKAFQKPKPPSHDANRRKRDFVAKLAHIGDGKLRFSPRILEPKIKSISKELDWIADRLGERIEDMPEPCEDQISSMGDLAVIADQQVEVVEDLAGQGRSNKPVRDRVIDALNIIYDA